MPPRPFIVLVVAFWVGTSAWLAYREWQPWLNTDGPPPFVVELADEAAEQHALWSVWRDGTRVGTARSHFAPRKDDTFELVTELRNLEVPPVETLGIRVKAKVPKLDNVFRINRQGLLTRTFSAAEVEIHVGQGPLGVFDLKVKAEITGRVVGDELHPVAVIDSPAGRAEQTLEPVRLATRNVISPLLPLTHIRGLTPGRRWKLTAVDPVGEAVVTSLTQTARKLFGDNKELGTLLNQFSSSRPKDLFARVLPEKQALEWNGLLYECFVIEYTSPEVSARTWVRADESAEVLRQEADLKGQRVVYQREDLKAKR